MRLLNIHELAGILGVKSSSVRRWWSLGLVPEPMRIGGRIRWNENVVREWIDDGCKPATSGTGQTKKEVPSNG